MKRLLTLSFQYYYLLLLYNIAFSTVITFLFVFDAHVLNLKSGLFAKVLGFGCAVLLYGYTSNKTYFYFHNAGVTIIRLVITAFLIDLLAYAVLVSISTFVSGL